MKARIYKVKQGYDIVNSSGMLWKYTTKLKYLGRIDPKKWQPSGVLLSKIPDHLKEIFFNLQKQS
jgi:hypothetical protein